MPAAAVIPAPKAYFKVAAVKKLVVGILVVHLIDAIVIEFMVALSWAVFLDTLGYVGRG